MLTPQQIDEQGFAKAVFGGYDMREVDEFLETMANDYKTLYKENAVLKSKLRILVEKLEEYRQQETTMQNAVAAAEQEAAQVKEQAQQQAELLKQQALQEAEACKEQAQQQADQMMAEAEKTAQHAAAIASRRKEIDQQTELLNQAKQAASSFIDTLEKDIQHHLDLLQNLKMMDLTPEKVDHAEQEEPAAEEPAEEAAEEKAEPAAEESSASDDIAAEIEQNLEKIVGSEPVNADTTFDTKVLRGLHPESITAKFGQLKFGKNYNPTEK